MRKYHFSIKVNTIFEKSPLPLSTWLPALSRFDQIERSPAPPQTEEPNLKKSLKELLDEIAKLTEPERQALEEAARPLRGVRQTARGNKKKK